MAAIRSGFTSVMMDGSLMADGKSVASYEYNVTKSEINALYRNPDHPKYMECGDQLLRNFLNGLVIYKRGPMPKKGENKDVIR
jgi:hypothetical protein